MSCPDEVLNVGHMASIKAWGNPSLTRSAPAADVGLGRTPIRQKPSATLRPTRRTRVGVFTGQGQRNAPPALGTKPFRVSRVLWRVLPRDSEQSTGMIGATPRGLVLDDRGHGSSLSTVHAWQRAQVPMISRVWVTSVNPSVAASFVVQSSMWRESISRAAPHTRHTRWWWWSGVAQRR